MFFDDSDSGILFNSTFSSSRENSLSDWRSAPADRMSDTQLQLLHTAGAPGVDAAPTHSQQNVQQQLGAESGASASEHPMLTIDKLSQQLMAAALPFRGVFDLSTVFPNQDMIKELLRREDYATIIAMYRSRIQNVNEMSKVGPAHSLHAPVRDSRTTGESLTSNTEPRGPIPPATATKRLKRTRRAHPEPRVRQPCTDDSGDESGGCVPNREDFFQFLVAHVRENSSFAPWSVGKLRRAYMAAHPTHTGYKSWIGTIDQFGQWSNGGWYTVKQILQAAFPDKTDPQLESLMYKKTQNSMAPETVALYKKPRRERLYKMEDIYKFVIASMKENLSTETKTEACCRIAHEVETRWPVKANKPFKKALKVAWDEVQTDKPEAVVLCILKAQQVSLPSSATVLPSPAAPAAAGGGSPAPTGGQPAAAAAAEKG